MKATTSESCNTRKGNRRCDWDMHRELELKYSVNQP